jgi:hypothetical protein
MLTAANKVAVLFADWAIGAPIVCADDGLRYCVISLRI